MIIAILVFPGDGRQLYTASDTTTSKQMYGLPRCQVNSTKASFITIIILTKQS
jgi:hypothetical protein